MGDSSASRAVPPLPMLMKLYRRFTLWDYSRANIQLLQRRLPIAASIDADNNASSWSMEQLHSDSHHVPLGSALHSDSHHVPLGSALAAAGTGFRTNVFADERARVRGVDTAVPNAAVLEIGRCGSC